MSRDENIHLVTFAALAVARTSKKSVFRKSCPAKGAYFIRTYYAATRSLFVSFFAPWFVEFVRFF